MIAKGWTMTDQLPADRYIKEALRRSGYKETKANTVQGNPAAYPAVLALARMIEKYEPIPEPVDPDVEIVKEAKASLCIGLQSGDPMPSAGAIALRAIKLARERGVL